MTEKGSAMLDFLSCLVDRLAALLLEVRGLLTADIDVEKPSRSPGTPVKQGPHLTKSDIKDSFRPRSHSCPIPGSEAHHRPHSLMSIRTRRPELLTWVDYTTWLSTAICPHKGVSAKATSRARLYMDTPCATSFVIGPSCQKVEKGSWLVKFSTARFLRLF